jgi:DNA processing protein
MSWDEERIARLRLSRTSGIGPLTLARLLEEYGNARSALEALPDRVRKAGKRELHIVDTDRAMREIERTERYGAKILFHGDADFPDLLGSLSPPPLVLTCKGDLCLTQKTCIAMVGARNASAAAIRMSGDLARDLGAQDWVVVSGLARGVDTAAHKGALKTGTIAVIAGGVDNIYPPQNSSLYNEICETGLVISESPFGYEPRARDFPRRNRLITGLALGVVVVEAAVKSGSLISARTALEQGREVMAVPGSPLDPRTKGSNSLIRSGATLVETAEHVIEIISPMQSAQPDLFREDAAAEYDVIQPDDISENDLERLYEFVSPVPVSLSDLANAADMPVRTCAMLLVELELSGRVRSLPGGMVKTTL